MDSVGAAWFPPLHRNADSWRISWNCSGVRRNTNQIGLIKLITIKFDGCMLHLLLPTGYTCVQKLNAQQ